MNREHNKSLAESTMRIMSEGAYRSPRGQTVRIAEAVRTAVDAVRVYTPDELMQLIAEPATTPVSSTTFEVRNETTLTAARRLVVERDMDRVLALNFASAKNPGGGFLNGAQAQEESLARSSALYPTLLAAPGYYDANRAYASNLYTDHMILSPDVPVLRDDSGALLEEPYLLTFLTAPAPNAGAVERNKPGEAARIRPVLERRAAMVLAVAEQNDYRHLVLGAWGCGVFRNDPTHVAQAFAALLLPGGRFAQSFEDVAFAVLDRADEAVIRPFRAAFR